MSFEKQLFMVGLVLGFIWMVSPAASVPVVDGVSTDPAFIGAGDYVNISVNMHENEFPDKNWDSDKRLKVTLHPDNSYSEEYIDILKKEDSTIGFLYPEGVWNEKFRMKVDSNAPTGIYAFELRIQYLENGEPVVTSDNETMIFERDFTLRVDKEGADLFGSIVSTEPDQLRPGNDPASVKIRLTNTGEKPIEELTVVPVLPEDITPSFSGDERFYIGNLNEGVSKDFDLNLDLDDDLKSGRKDIELRTVYEDLDDNKYNETLSVPLRIEGRPDLELVEGTSEINAGSTREIMFEIKNTGEQDAEGVTARIITERTQPFSLEDRSHYVGEIGSGETSEAALSISADNNAARKVHNLKVQLRASGDSEEGDHSVYTFTEVAELSVGGEQMSLLIPVGIVGAVISIGAVLFRRKRK